MNNDKQLEENKPTISQLLSMPVSDIVSFLGSVYEHSPWVAENFVAQDVETYRSLETMSQLASALKCIVDNSIEEKKLTLLRAHPDLCEKVGKLEQLTKESQEEQSRSGLQSLTDDELQTFNRLNKQYKERYQFPFILAVRNATKYTVLSALRGRVNNSLEKEFIIAVQQVHKIAWMRLLTKFNTSNAKGFLTCHVLDTANGCPGMTYHQLVFV